VLQFFVPLLEDFLDFGYLIGEVFAATLGLDFLGFEEEDLLFEDLVGCGLLF
jgi:hypothetical protein